MGRTRRGASAVAAGAVLLALCPVVAGGQLVWEPVAHTVTAKASASSTTVAYAFKVAGKTPVRITSARASCSCTTIRFEARAFQPGESGRLTVTFRFGGRIGLQRFIIWVTTDAKPPRPQVLRLAVTVPEVVRMTPRRLRWHVGGPAAEKRLTLDVVHDKPVRIVKLVCSSSRLKATLETVRPGKTYAIRVKPKDTLKPLEAALTLRTDFPVESPRVFRAYADIVRLVPAANEQVPPADH